MTTTTLCGARYRHNRTTTCGKSRGHLNADPLHQFDPTDNASMAWFDYDTEQRLVPAPDLLGALGRAVEAARADRRKAGERRG